MTAPALRQAQGDGRRRFRIEPYLQFARAAMAREATYRFDVFTSVASVLVRVYLLRMVWTALYARNAAPSELPLHAIITYSTVALLMGLVMDIDQTRALHDKLHDGSIATDFMKPISVPLYFFSDGTGEVLFHAALIVPSLLFALLIVHIDVPGPLVLAAFFVSFLLGYLVGFCINFILNCTAFWTLEIHAVQLIVTWVTDLFGGEIIPLVIFPLVLQRVAYVLPFAAMFSTPLLIYVGVIPPERWAQALGLQLFWVVVLGSAATMIWRAGAKRVVVQGG
ncbi:MAG: ABC-2 family transporter protein [Candidatus Eremiobacteraeota bacterium]|nr:ABC-2 family transporter protein [Candidatus Eremiobacteraeota bacterium]